MMMPAAKWIAEYLAAQQGSVKKVLDIAAGHGIFGIEIAKQFPEANIVAVDWPNVLEVAKEQAQEPPEYKIAIALYQGMRLRLNMKGAMMSFS